jgi:hypothetical protein
MAHRFADEIVPKAELISVLSHDAGLGQLFDRGEEGSGGQTEHLRQLGDRERSPERSGRRGDLTR